MIIVTVAIGEQYHKEVERLKQSVGQDVQVFNENHELYAIVNEDSLINALYHKANFANDVQADENEPVLFMDADMFSLKENPLSSFSVNENTDFAFVPYQGKWHFPDAIRQQAFDFFGYKINSGFMYFRTLAIAKEICTKWANAYLERAKLYGVAKNINKNEYDEYALMIALVNHTYQVELLDKKWNDWELNTEEEIRNSDSMFFQSHNFLDILEPKEAI